MVLRANYHIFTNILELQTNYRNEDNEVEFDEGSPMSELTGRLRNNEIEWLRTSGTFNDFKLCASMCFPPMVPAKHWKMNRSEVGISSLLTVADEALALVILENNFEEWIEIAKGKRSGNNGRTDTRNKNRLTKYTHGGSRKDGTRKGWSLAGRKRFNDIFSAIKTERTKAVSKERERRLKEEWCEGQGRSNNREGELRDEECSNDLVREEELFVIKSDFDSE